MTLMSLVDNAMHNKEIWLQQFQCGHLLHKRLSLQSDRIRWICVCDWTTTPIIKQIELFKLRGFK